MSELPPYMQGKLLIQIKKNTTIELNKKREEHYVYRIRYGEGSHHLLSTSGTVFKTFEEALGDIKTTLKKFREDYGVKNLEFEVLGPEKCAPLEIIVIDECISKDLVDKANEEIRESLDSSL